MREIRWNNKKQNRVERDEPRHRILSEFARSSALAPFRVRNYRFQWLGDLLTSWAFEMEMLILGWYVLVETGSVLLLTLFGALNYTGTLIAPMFGVIGDRIGQRDLLVMMRASYALLAVAMTVLALTGYLTPTYVLVSVAIMGLVRPSDLGVRGALGRQHHAAGSTGRRDQRLPHHVGYRAHRGLAHAAPACSRLLAWVRPM